ncbi:hypothetical protein HK099_001318 [Clydaea vesicula]|uniref:Sterol regulatory element-binding protein cleavage-activating protein n=1 Tax=Clydaea vesicula TaxID=447962 RepID=A0AAD5XX95_9FUNG|nr:hypothetical protein HK099_001318 [Clydaea vesicula]
MQDGRNWEQETSTEPSKFWESPSSRAPIQEELFLEKYGSKPFLHLEQLFLNSTLTMNNNSPGVLVHESLLLALDLQERISTKKVSCHNKTHLCQLSDICFKPLRDRGCLVQSPLEYWSYSKISIETDKNLLNTLSKKEILSSFNIPVPRQSVLGGIKSEKDENGNVKILAANELVLTYFLEQGYNQTNENDPTKMEDYIVIWDRIIQSVISDYEINAPLSVFKTSIKINDEVLYKSTLQSWRSGEEVKHLYYEYGGSNIFTGEFSILLVSYILVFVYISLVMSKVDLVKSKFGLGLTAVVMIFSSLFMSVGLWELLGINSMLVPWEVLPFLVIAIGVENILVLTNSVVSTSLDLPVKERVGLGGEMFILLMGSLINIRALQEFCLFAAVSIVIDYFLQITFFISVLSIDIRRLELFELHKLSRAQNQNYSASKVKENYYENKHKNWKNLFFKRIQDKICSWSTLVIVLIMVLIGFGIYGSTVPLNEVDLTVRKVQNETEFSMSDTADVFWSVINPSHSARYVEIRPPLYITFTKELSLVNAQLNNTANVVANGNDKPLPHINIQSQIDEKLTRLQSSPPTLSIIIVVLSLVLIVLLSVAVTSCLYYVTRGTSSLYRFHWTHLPTQPRFFNNSNCKWPIQQVKVKDIWGGSWRDVERLSLSDSVEALCWETNTKNNITNFDLKKDVYANVGGYSLSGIYEKIGFAFSDDSVFCWNVSCTEKQCHLLSTKISSAITNAKIVCLEISQKKTLANEVSNTNGYVALALSDGVLELLPLPENRFQKIEWTTCTLKPSNNFRPTCIHIDNLNSRIIVGSEDGSIHVWQIPEDFDGYSSPLTEEFRYKKFKCQNFAITKILTDAKSVLLIAGAKDGSIFFWDYENAKMSLHIESKTSFEESLVAKNQTTFNGLRKRHVASEQEAVKGDGTGNNENKENFFGHSSSITNIVVHQVKETFSTCTYILVTSSLDENVLFWELEMTSEVNGGVVSHLNRRGSLSKTAKPSSPLSPGQLNTTPLEYFPATSKVGIQNIICSAKSLGKIYQFGCKTIAFNGSVIVGVRRNFVHEENDTGNWNWQVWMVNLDSREEGKLRVCRTIHISQDVLFKGTSSTQLFNDRSSTSPNSNKLRNFFFGEESVESNDESEVLIAPNVPFVVNHEENFFLNRENGDGEVVLIKRTDCWGEFEEEISLNVTRGRQDDFVVNLKVSDLEDSDGWYTDDSDEVENLKKTAKMQALKKQKMLEEEKKQFPVLFVRSIQATVWGFAFTFGNYVKICTFN